MGLPWEPDSTEECWSDREAWRGGLYADPAETVTFDVDAWRSEGEAGCVHAEPEPVELEESDWPEEFAGPEYWLYKRYGC